MEFPNAHTFAESTRRVKSDNEVAAPNSLAESRSETGISAMSVSERSATGYAISATSSAPMESSSQERMTRYSLRNDAEVALQSLPNTPNTLVRLDARLYEPLDRTFNRPVGSPLNEYCVRARARP